MKLIDEGKLDPTFLITHRFKFEQIDEAYKLFAHQKNECLKVIVYTDFGLQWERDHQGQFRSPALTGTTHSATAHSVRVPV